MPMNGKRVLWKLAHHLHIWPTKMREFEHTCQVIILISQSSYHLSCRKCQKKWKSLNASPLCPAFWLFFCFSIQVIDCVMNCIVWQTQLHLWKMTNSFCCCDSCLIDQNAVGCFSEARQSAQTFKGQTTHGFHKKILKVYSYITYNNYVKLVWAYVTSKRRIGKKVSWKG